MLTQCLFLKVKKFISEQKLFIKLGVISWSDASADFWFKVLRGYLEKYTEKREEARYQKKDIINMQMGNMYEK